MKFCSAVPWHSSFPCFVCTSIFLISWWQANPVGDPIGIKIWQIVYKVEKQTFKGFQYWKNCIHLVFLGQEPLLSLIVHKPQQVI